MGTTSSSPQTDATFAGELGGKTADDLATTSSRPARAFYSIFAAIDFGTTYFGYAFHIKVKGGLTQDILGNGRGKEREPTCLLLKPDKTFAALGYKAVEEFYNNLDTDEQKSHYYFRQFKMRLYEKKLSRMSDLSDENGNLMNALEVFSVALLEIKQNILKHMNQSTAAPKTIDADDIDWVVTIPAIWTDEARQFMREAAAKAGLNRTKLVLEPEAAALYAIEKPLCLGKEFTAEKFSPYTKYLVADIGGGTVDMCVHEILDEGQIRELYRATGCDAGGCSVNQEFLLLFKNIFGASTIDTFRQKYPHQYRELETQIEQKKCSFEQNTEALTFTLPTEIIAVYESQNEENETLENMISKLDLEDTVKYKSKGNRLQFLSSVVKKLFDSSVNSIIARLTVILTDCSEERIKFILLVGGYSQSDYLRSRIEEAFPDLKIIHVEDGRLAVMKGAVMAATKPHFIKERRSRFSYGFRWNAPFIEGVHPAEFKFHYKGMDWCKGVFKKMIEVGQVLKYGQQFSWESRDTCKEPIYKHLPMYISLWRSPLKSPTYCHREEDQCEEVGRIEVAAPNGGWLDVVNFVDSLVVGETELTMKCLIKETGEEHECTIDFL